jgi:hypothetical protein
MRFLLVFITVFAGLAGYSQDLLWAELKTKFPGENSAFSKKNAVLTVDFVKDSLEIYLEVEQEVVFLQDIPVTSARERLYGNSFSEVTDIEVKLLIPENGKYKPLKLSDFERKTDSRNSVFYDDSYYYEIIFPSVQNKAVTSLKYRQIIKDPHLLHSYLFQSDEPVYKGEFKIRVHKNINLDFDLFNKQGFSIVYSKEEKGNYLYHSWKYENMPGYSYEENAPSFRYYIPHIIPRIKSYQIGKTQTTVLSDPNDLFHWYLGFLPSETESSEEMKKIVNSLISGISDEQEKVKQIYYWVQENIRYIAFEDGMRGFKPNTGNYVCEKRYGDCKDMASILVSLLKTAGIKGYFTWVGTRDIPYSYSETPTPNVDNHMIATYINPKGEIIYLDGTGEYTPFGMPTAMIQGKEVLIAIKHDEFRILTVPVISPSENLYTDSVRVILTGNGIEGSGRAHLYGYSKVNASYSVNRSKETDMKNHLIKMLGKGSNKFVLKNYSVTNNLNRDLPLAVNYQFTVDDYVKQHGDEIFINLNLDKIGFNDLIQDRNLPREFEFNKTYKVISEAELPENYELDYLPSGSEFGDKKFSYRITYSVKDNIVRQEKLFTVNHLLLRKDDFNSWNEVIKNLSKAYKETIILKKINK